MIALQRDRWILWLPVGMIAGAALWLAAPSDPPWWLGPAILVLGTAAAFGLAMWPGPRPDGVWVAIRHVFGGACALIAAAGAGLGSAHLRGATVAQAPYIASEEPVRVEGWVVANDASDNGPRLRLLVRHIEGVEAPPRYVRVSVSEAGLLTAGRTATCRAVLGPPSGPMAPGGYDFARRAYFERLGATGFAFGRCRPAAFEPPPGWLDRQRLTLAAIRADLSAAIVAAAPGRGGAIAAALVTGDRSSIDTATNESLRDSGLGHLLSVSGIHMGVVGGLVFAAVLWTLSLIAPIALRFPVKKIAAVAALLVLAAYLIVSGSSVPALRSFVMACVAFGAVLIDRPAISMRGLALAAFVVVLIFPESVLEPGFQMSFAATMALVALFEMLKRGPHEPALPTPGPLIGALNASARGIGGVLLISFVAGLATDPFAIYHFQRFSLYSLPANLIAAPIMSFLVAPAAGVAAILAPFGLAEPALQVMASALDLIAAVGQTFGERPEAVRALPRPPDLAFALCVFALLWAALWRGALRWGALPVFAASVALYATAPQPIVAFDADLRAVYARGNDAQWRVMTSGRSTYARDRLGAMLGIAPPQIERLAPPEACGDTICMWRRGARDFAFVRTEEGLPAACLQGASLIARVNAPADYVERCGLTALMHAPDIAQMGGAMMYEDGETLRIERAWPLHIQRAWTVRGSADQE
ncbi:MAG TPA: ComEC/Rec2 family competence protein [Vitreimonas sp.]|nr:ComEC/Rec2 family competence protein [Vitreimonas sp.]